MKSSIGLAVGMILLSCGPVVAQTPQANLHDLYACRTVLDVAARLDCYEQETALLEDAERRAEIAVVDRRAEQQRRRAAFGAKASEDVGATSMLSEIKSTLVSAMPDSAGLFVFVLADGARWMQVDDAPIPGRLRSGSAVIVKRTMLGGYKMTIDTRPAIKVRRM
ncbi:hypothetical protein [uncultured Xylophilus sp.]|uniref:hypothetical protein n=1 Tax=uncultured Xylophilus sp. TaxID=296832 RepID=UPI0025FC6A2C|nr:hypothetical protein [uncultured Xylophilus sp.]